MKHPSGDISGSISNVLQGKRIVLAISGSVAALRAVDIARLLMRHGAEVYPVMSAAAAELIGPPLVEWATGHAPVLKISGAIEHVALCGNTSTKADLLLIAPATANTVGKIACGIDDTTVTTFATTALGEGIPICLVPAMHEPMYRHQGVLDNLGKLEGMGIRVLAPEIAEGKAKIPSPESVVEEVLGILDQRPRPLAGERVLITAGRTVEYIDPVRLLTNNSSGKMGMALAQSCLNAGARVTVIYGKGTAAVPRGVEVVRVETSEDMRAAVHAALQQQRYRLMFAAAAVGDWRPKERAEKKISTHGTSSLTLELEPTPKIIDGIREAFPGITLVAFRALHALEEGELLENAFNRMRKADADFIAVNDVSKQGAGFESDTNEMFLIDREGGRIHIPMDSKRAVAARILDEVLRASN